VSQTTGLDRDHTDLSAGLLRDHLTMLGGGASIAELCRVTGMERAEFLDRWEAECRRRVPRMSGSQTGRVVAAVTIRRDRWSVPHIEASTDTDLFFGYGYATAQDRRFQLDYERRIGLGRLAEVLGRSALESDRTARIVDLPGIAEREWAGLNAETADLLASFSAGINAATEQAEALPIEFDLLDYSPEPWRPLDSIAIAGAFRWYLTGRLPVLTVPELLKGELAGTGLYRWLMATEHDAVDAIVVPSGASAPTRAAVSLDPEQGIGSNNWALSGKRTANGASMVAGDPHIAFGAVSCWYEARLHGDSFDTAGIGYVGVPGFLFGRNALTAWSVTNNLCSQRDLYREIAHPNDELSYLYDGKWESVTERREKVEVRGEQSAELVVRSTRNGPIVDSLLPALATEAGSVSLRWLGTERCDWIAALLRLNRVSSARDVPEAVRGWLVPTFNLIVGDTSGHLEYHATGRLPVRDIPERGYRPGSDPAHTWREWIPIDAMPRAVDPSEGWIASANNRNVAENYPYELGGVWDQPYRARRIGELLAAKDRHTVEELGSIQQDVVSLRARECLPSLLATLGNVAPTPPIEFAISRLTGWDGHMTVDSIAASLFEVFLDRWTNATVAERVRPELRSIVHGSLRAVATRLLIEDPLGWFQAGRRTAAIAEAMTAAVGSLGQRFGPDPTGWAWGKLHRLRLRHSLSAGDLGELLDRGDLAVPGTNVTVFNTGLGPDFDSPGGANFRILVDLSVSPAEYHAIDAQGQSGHPGSPHYGDQTAEWLAGRYRRVSFAGPREDSEAVLVLHPE
jgi:penicillin amidase